jgi:hypothetical protein
VPQPAECPTLLWTDLGLDSKSRKLDMQIALKSRIANRHATVGIIGLGYVGLPLGWKPCIGLGEGLKNAFAFYQDQR